MIKPSKGIIVSGLLLASLASAPAFATTQVYNSQSNTSFNSNSSSSSSSSSNSSSYSSNSFNGVSNSSTQWSWSSSNQTSVNALIAEWLSYLFSHKSSTGSSVSTGSTGSTDTSTVDTGSSDTGTSATGMSDTGTIVDTSPAASSPVSAVPEPETYAMLAAGLAVVGFAARRRTAKAAK
jgi:hypothetical protein